MYSYMSLHLGVVRHNPIVGRIKLISISAYCRTQDYNQTPKTNILSWRISTLSSLRYGVKLPSPRDQQWFWMYRVTTRGNGWLRSFALNCGGCCQQSDASSPTHDSNTQKTLELNQFWGRRSQFYRLSLSAYKYHIDGINARINNAICEYYK